MNKNRAKVKGRSDRERQFFGLPHCVLDSPAFLSLSHHAKALLLDIGRQFNGFNNGALQINWARMKRRGWRSQTTLNKAKDELLTRGLIERTRIGYKRVTALYALTWKPIDACRGFDDVAPTRTPSHRWKEYT